jgi:YVTN family beta-propeller protein
MKYLKLVIAGGIAFCTILVVIYFIKQPSYSIKTEGTLYVVNKISQSISIFDLSEGKLIKELAMDTEPHEATALTNPNRIVVTNYGKTDTEGKSITLINAESNTIENTISLGESPRPHGIISLSNPNKVGVVTDIGNHLSIVNVKTGELEKQISTQQKMSHLLVQHPSKPLIYISNINSGTVSVIDIELEKVIKIIPCSESTEGIDISPDGSELWVSNIKDNTITVIDTNTYNIIDTFSTGKEPLRLKFSKDGNYCLISNSKEGTISVYDTTTKKQIKTIPLPGNKNILDKIIYHTPRPVGILMHPNGTYAFVSNFTAGRIEVINMETFTLVSSIDVGQMPDGLALIN